MAIFIDSNTKVIVQGITGRQGTFHTKRMIEYGTKVVAGVTPGKRGQEVHGIPVYNTVKDAVEDTNATASIIFVPAKYAIDAVLEAIDANLNPIVVITEHIPIHDAMLFVRLARLKGISIIGPNTPGIIAPEQSLVGIMPGHIFKKGNIGIVSRSGTLTYEIADILTQNGFGQSTSIGIGGDPITGLDFIDVLNKFENDPETEAIVLIGEIGGDSEERAASYIKKNIKKPVVAYIAGQTAPPGKRMGHAGAIISGRSGTAQSKIEAFKKVGVKVATLPSQIPSILSEVLKR
ncbi:MAG: succinate--CoA ligase subunit alpha [Candidatus Odinarchaeota archaeon]|nr:succinate--CoA ligase subunit alpha [Candidatus Odinarchaeota archaeon]